MRTNPMYVVTFLLAVSVATGACEEGYRERRVAERPGATASAPEDLTATRRAFIRDAETRLNTLRSQVMQLQNRAEQKTGDVQENMREQVDELAKKVDDLGDKVEDLKQKVDSKGFEDAQEDVQKILNEIDKEWVGLTNGRRAG